MITCELRLLLTDSRLACEDEGCLTTINLKETGEGVGLCQIAKHLNLTHGVNHTPLRRSRTQDDCFITDLAWSVTNTASQIFTSWESNSFTALASYFCALIAHLKLSPSACVCVTFYFISTFSLNCWHQQGIVLVQCCLLGPPSICLHLTVLNKSVNQENFYRYDKRHKLERQHILAGF